MSAIAIFRQPFKLLQYIASAITQNDPSPKDASATGAHTRPFPKSERTSVTADARNPHLQDATANEYFAGSDRLLAYKRTSTTNNPMLETKMRPAKAKTLRHTGAANRGLDLTHRTHAQISEGIGKT